MLTSECVWAYREQFNSNECIFAEPSNNIMITDKDSNKSYISPHDETEKIFMDRLVRCEREQRNLFFEEWEEYIPQNNVRY